MAPNWLSKAFWTAGLAILMNVMPIDANAQTSYQVSGDVKENFTQELITSGAISMTSIDDPSVADLDSLSDEGYDINISTTSVVIDNPQIPGKFSLNQNYPNPYNPSTMVPFSIERAGLYTLESFNIRGEKLFEKVVYLNPGDYAIPYGGASNGGLELIRLRGDKYVGVIKTMSGDGGDGSGFGKVGAGDRNKNNDINPQNVGKAAMSGPIDVKVEISGEGLETYVDTVTLQEGMNSMDFNEVKLSDYDPFFTGEIPNINFNSGQTGELDLTYLIEYYGNDPLNIAVTHLPSWLNYSVEERIVSFTNEAGENGSPDSLKIAISDDEDIIESSPFSVIVNYVNNPHAISIDNIVSSLDEDTQGPIIIGTINIQDTDGPNGEYIFDITATNEVSFSIDGLNVVYTGAPENYNGDSDYTVIVADNDHSAQASENLDLLPVNDAPVFSGNIEGVTFLPDEEMPEYIIIINEYFSDPEGDNLTIETNLSPEVGSYEGGELFIFPSQGDSLDVVVTVNDGELSTSSNNFSVIWPNEVILPPDTFSVYFEMRDFKTDNLISEDISIWTIDGVEYTSNDGTFQMNLAEGTHSFNATNPNTIDGSQGIFHSGDYLFLRRPGDTENFEQRSGFDDISNIVIAGQDTIIAYKIMADFNLEGIAPYLNNLGHGTVRFGPDDLQSYAWFDTSGSNGNPVNYVRTAIARLLTEEIPRVTQGKLQLQYMESETQPSDYPLLSMFINSSVPGSGTNITSFDEDYNIIHANASWPSNPGIFQLFIEILQAIGDLPDLAGGDPPIISNSENGYIINEFGESTFSLLYFVNPGTYFND